ncbi:monothiol glutaredoxin [Starmerella bacillaris]|uniref:Monothiol glutaredoxin n=1 Tax=Starmerella bacillaris TaxID=1247836 RepID=A0AAV5RJ70_STABA|nr:monothiol glutaredoxin [Starmerella bacillaris]
MGVIQITSDEQFKSLIEGASADKIVILYFHADWAEPCEQMNTIFESLSQIYPQHEFIAIDADKFESIAEDSDVSAVPHFCILRNKLVLKELTGADPRALAKAIRDVNGDTTASAATSANGTPKTASPQNEPEETGEALNDRLKKLVSAAPVMLFMKGTPAEPKCGFSRQLVAILRENQVRFGFFDILKDNAVRNGLKEFSDWPTFPQLYVNGELQGGLDIIKESLEDDPNFFDSVK